jgi:hypothetical protein
VDFNWEVARYPVVTVSNMRARNFDQTLDALTKLAQAGVVAPFPELSQFIIRELGLPQPATSGGAAPAITDAIEAHD